LLDKPVEYKCTSCDIEFENSSQLLAHNQKGHTKSRGKFDPLTCHLCGKILFNKENLGRHIRQIHEKRYSRECKICGKNLLSNQELILHMVRKHKKDPQVAELKAQMEEKKKLSRKASKGCESAPYVKKAKLTNRNHIEAGNPDGPELDENKMETE